jgi:putative Ca2+/H+ antiporter (TMEM165/GDT1 family)
VALRFRAVVVVVAVAVTEVAAHLVVVMTGMVAALVDPSSLSDMLGPPRTQFPTTLVLG